MSGEEYGIVGGIVGANHRTIVENCYNIGKVAGGEVIGGISASNIQSIVENCCNIGTISGSCDIGGITGDDDVEKGLENCYYIEGCNAEGTVFDIDTGISKTAEQFASGEVAYLLGSEWGQKIGIDEYPVLGGDKVYFINNSYTNEKTENKYPYEITGLRFTDISGNEIILPEQGKSFIVETDIVKIKERDEKDYLFVAVYDTDGALMSLDYVKAKFTVDGECSFGFNVPAQEKAVGSVKAFVWNTFNSMEPLAQTKILAPVVFE